MDQKTAEEFLSRMGMYTLYDGKAEAFMRPFFAENDDMARRAVMDAMGEEGHIFQKHPEDFSLYYLGNWDDVRGQVTGVFPAKAISSGIELFVAQRRLVKQQFELMKEVSDA